jgi:hypothetical protein
MSILVYNVEIITKQQNKRGVGYLFFSFFDARFFVTVRNKNGTLKPAKTKSLQMKSLFLLFALVICVLSCPYVIQVGDTLDQIATGLIYPLVLIKKDQNCDLTAILNANPGLNPALLQVGQTIELPSTCSSCGSIRNLKLI